MIKIIQNWLDVRKQYKLEQKLIEMRSDAKQIISGVMLELVKYDTPFVYNTGNTAKVFIYGITYGDVSKNLEIMVYFDKIKIKHEQNTIATYEVASWWQKMKHQRNLKKFIYTEDAVTAISNMIIIGEAI